MNARPPFLRDLPSGPWFPDKWRAAYAQRRAIKNKAAGDNIWANADCTQALVGFQNVQTLPELQTGEKNFDLSEFMQRYNFAHVGIAETGRNWDKLKEDDCLPYRLRRHFPQGNLACIHAHNIHANSSSSYQIEGTARLSHGAFVSFLTK
eukprot:8770431-Ditylum_brightwellii.AAC.1